MLGRAKAGIERFTRLLYPIELASAYILEDIVGFDIYVEHNRTFYVSELMLRAVFGWQSWLNMC